MALWTPAQLAPLVELDDTCTVTIATGVSAWADKSGNGRDAVQATGANQPALVSGGLNGKNVIQFDAVNDFLLISGVPAQTAVTGFVVCKAVDPQPDVYNSGLWGYSTASLVTMYPGTNGSIYDNFASSARKTTVNPTPSLGDPRIYSVESAAGSWINRLDGVQLYSTTSNIVTTATGIYLGRTNGSTQYFLDGYIAAFLLLAGIPTDDDRQRVEGFYAWHFGLQGNLAADHPYKDAAPTIADTIVRASLDQIYTLRGDPRRALLDQTYHITNRQLAVLIQVYGLQLLAVLAQHYGDVPVVRQYLDQYYGSADLLRRLLAQPYGDTLQLRQSLVESWNLPGDLLAIMEMRYSISEGDLRALMSYNYDLSEYTLLRQKLEQIYIAGPDAEEAQEPLFSVTTDIGESLKPHHINIEIDEGEYAIKGEIHLADQNDFLLCKHIETEIIIPIDSTEYYLLVEGPRQSRPEWGRVEYYVPLASKTILLDSPYATPIDQEFTGALASVIVAGLAAIKSIPVTWQLIDWYIPTGVLTANNESPLSIIRRIVNAVGGILQSSPAGELICLPEYPISTTGWETATPDFYLTDMDNFFSVDSTSDIREGYNRFLISDKVIDESGLTLEQVDIDENTKDIYVYQVPWNSLERVVLHTSGGVWVSIVAEGITTEERTEIVEIIAGEGMTQKPFYSKVSHDYKETELGLITINEDKTVSTELSQNSLVEVVYNTKYWKFRVRDAEIEKVQFFPEAIVI